MPDPVVGRRTPGWAAPTWRRLLAVASAPLAALILGAASGPPTPPTPPTPGVGSTGTLRLTKVDANTQKGLAGAVFDVHRTSDAGKVDATLTTDGNGVATATLVIGMVCLTERTPPPGYRNGATFSPSSCVAITANQETDVQAADTPAGAGRLRLIKTDPSGSPIMSGGATFQVHQGGTAGPVVATVTTDDSGTVTATGLPVPSSYCVVETAAPAGFQVQPTFTPAQCGFITGTALQTVSVADPPTAAATPTPTPTPALTGELQVAKTDLSGQPITTPGFTFNVHVGSSSGPVIATLTTDATGTATAGALNPATYCVEETGAPSGYQVQPTYSPSACVQVMADTSQGRNPTVITVSDPPQATPTPSDTPAAGTPSPGAGAAQGPGSTASGSSGPSVLTGVLARGLLGIGALLVLGGAILIVVAIRRRRLLTQPSPVEPDNIWYDSTIT